MNSNFRYEPLCQDELKEMWLKHKGIIESFISSNRYRTDNIYIDENIVMAIIAKVHQRKKYFEYFHGLNMSECKEVALISFWYVKLQPICAVSKEKLEIDSDYFESINEKLAIYYIIVSLQGLLEKEKKSISELQNVPKEYIEELIYSFTYRDISKESMILLVETMAIFMGLNPYTKKE